MEAENSRNNPQNLQDKVRSQGTAPTEADRKRAATGETNLNDVAEEQHGLAHGEMKQHSQEFMESSGDALAPTVDPPKNNDPEENTAPSQ